MDKGFKEVIENHLTSVCSETRKKVGEIAKDPLFTPIYDISIRDQKELAQKRLRKIAEARIVSIRDFQKNPENIFTMHEMLSYVDGSLATKFTVQFNLFGGTIIGLGTQRHEKYVEGIDSLAVTGCFCLTELGYGNNAVEMETTAIWDEKQKRFVINTPTINSQKYWITNAAYHATYGIIFAQTYVKNKHEGINAFIVKLREDSKTLCKGVSIDDMGHKMSLNGVDNARIILRNVSVDRADLLNKLADIDSEGNFKSSIPGKRQRFLAAANRLLSGRICIASMMMAGTKLSLLVTSKYGSVRLSNGKTGKSDTPIANFQIFQNQITPLIVRTLIYNSALMSIRKIYSDYCINPSNYDNNAFNNIIRLCCFIKPMIAWNAGEAGNILRERCGGMGFLSINKVEGLVASAHSGITAEGDSSVLMQKVSKEYVEDYAKKVVEAPKLSQDINEILKKPCVFNFRTLLDLIKFREVNLLEILTEKTVTNLQNIYQVWMMEESDLIQDLAMIYGERYCLEEADKNIGSKNELVDKMIKLQAALVVKRHIGWFLLNKALSNDAALKLPNQINALIKEISKHSLDICESFGVPKHLVMAPIYTGYQEYYKEDKTGGEHYNIKGRPKF